MRLISKISTSSSATSRHCSRYLTFVTIDNKPDIAKDYLLRSLALQNVKYELKLIDNTGNKFKSAAEAYNSVKQINGDYLLFAHQDAFFPHRDWLKTFEDGLSSLSHLGLVGVVGAQKPRFLNRFEVSSRFFLLQILRKQKLWHKHYLVGNVNYMEPRMLSEIPSVKASEVQTVDEIVLVIPRDVFQKVPFDEKLCNSWHLYGVDYSLTVRSLGYSVYALPFVIFHRSHGEITQDYFQTLTKLIEKHKAESVINTTCGLVPTSKILMKPLWMVRLRRKDSSQIGYFKDVLKSIYG